MKELAQIKQNKEFLNLFTQAVSYFHSSGVLSVLRKLGLPQQISQESPNYIALLAAQSEYSRGYNAALDDIINFREKFLDTPNLTAAPLDYGAINAAQSAGDLTKEEADELRSNI